MFSMFGKSPKAKVAEEEHSPKWDINLDERLDGQKGQRPIIQVEETSVETLEELIEAHQFSPERNLETVAGLEAALKWLRSKDQRNPTFREWMHDKNLSAEGLRHEIDGVLAQIEAFRKKNSKLENQNTSADGVRKAKNESNLKKGIKLVLLGIKLKREFDKAKKERKKAERAEQREAQREAKEREKANKLKQKANKEDSPRPLRQFELLNALPADGEPNVMVHLDRAVPSVPETKFAPTPKTGQTENPLFSLQSVSERKKQFYAKWDKMMDRSSFESAQNSFSAEV